MLPKMGQKRDQTLRVKITLKYVSAGSVNRRALIFGMKIPYIWP